MTDRSILMLGVLGLFYLFSSFHQFTNGNYAVAQYLLTMVVIALLVVLVILKIEGRK